MNMLWREAVTIVLMCLGIFAKAVLSQGLSLNPGSCLQDLVEFEIVATPLDAPDALAAHFPPNLTTLKLQYLPETWPSDKVLPDNWQVHQPAHLAYFLPACHQPGSMYPLSHML